MLESEAQQQRIINLNKAEAEAILLKVNDGAKTQHRSVFMLPIGDGHCERNRAADRSNQ